MKRVGIVCEYNPFHLGHQKQFRLLRRRFGAETAVVCAMSGDFVQRGEPALYDRAVRAEAAVRGGASLVLELPVTCALRSAEGFADGGVELLSRFAEAVSFGCERETGLRETAALLLAPEFPAALRAELDRGLSFAAARQRAVEALGGDGALLRTPNNILAVEYEKSVLRRGLGLETVPVLREGDYHAPEPEPENPSAASLRRTADFLPFVPPETRGCYAGRPRHTMAAGERAVLARLRAMGEEEFSRVPFGTEGLWRKVLREARKGGSLEELLQGAKSKRYSRTRLQRLVLCAYLGLTAADLAAPAPYVRVLAFDDRGRALLREHPGEYIMAGETPPDRAYAALEDRCALLYDLFREGPPVPPAPDRVFYLRNA